MMTPGTLLLHDNLTANGQNLLFSAPREVLVAHTTAEARAALTRIAEAGRDGLWAAGYLAYELGFVFEERLEALLPARSQTPLLWFGLYDTPQRLGPDQVQQLLAEAPDGRAMAVTPVPGLADYEKPFHRVKALIAAGDSYQVNLTFKARFALEGHPLGLYRRLAQSQQTAYGAYLDAGDHQVLSRSPELFVSLVADELSARPMKGTRRRGRTLAEDAAGRAALAEGEPDWKDIGVRLGELDWRRANAEVWEGRLMTAGRVSKSMNNVTLTTNVVKAHLGLDLTPEEQRVEESYLEMEKAT